MTKIPAPLASMAKTRPKPEELLIADLDRYLDFMEGQGKPPQCVRLTKKQIALYRKIAANTVAGTRITSERYRGYPVVQAE